MGEEADKENNDKRGGRRRKNTRYFRRSKFEQNKSQEFLVTFNRYNDIKVLKNSPKPKNF